MANRPAIGAEGSAEPEGGHEAPALGGGSDAAWWSRRALATFLALAVSTGFAAANPFLEALPICTSAGIDMQARENRFLADGWTKVTLSPRERRQISDGITVQNQPDENTHAEWAARREWANRLVIDDVDVILVAKGAVLARLATQMQTGYDNCVIYGVQDNETDDLLERLNAAGGMREWGYGFHGTMFAQTQAEDGSEWRTEVSLHGIRDAATLPLERALETTITATLITQKVREK
ncbi:hypothetical protein SAMN05421688_3199 [Poseidonocella pacifica]|uniref:Uncharacterized protein n=1 Tax=Poseidonocella pacifica TaxID=871651 RepID=A0A1I0YMU2_9RHOB|nr:hypothetical protein [Poseidonocella pacifica]SFB13638.1 hypothetical protein SAMN05421688_3199 [Poseidonocella pacifica]